MALNVINTIGRVMHKILFEWLMPKRYRGMTKERIFEIIFKSDTPAGKRFDVTLLVLILANIALLVVDSLFKGSTMTTRAHLAWNWVIFNILEWGFTIIFTFEYYLRIYCLKKPWRYVFSFWGIIDFISIFPAYLSLLFPVTQAFTVFRLLRVMRIFRIFKMERFQKEAKYLIGALKASAVKMLIFMLFMLVASIILGTMMYSFEGRVNDQFDSVLTGIYWAVITITTVGYGDVAPVTGPGRFVAVLVMLLGYAIIAVPTGIVAGETMNEYRRVNRKRNPNKTDSEVATVDTEEDEERDAINN